MVEYTEAGSWLEQLSNLALAITIYYNYARLVEI